MLGQFYLGKQARRKQAFRFAEPYIISLESFLTYVLLNTFLDFRPFRNKGIHSTISEDYCENYKKFL